MSDTLTPGPAQTAPITPRTPWYRRRGPVACLAGATLLAGVFGIGIPVGAAMATTAPSASGAISSVLPRASDAYGSQQAVYPQQGTTTQTEATEADADESTGVAIIETVLGYQSAEAAGTGLVLTDDGLILTNNHVVEGSTEISVTIASTGETYSATVVGTDAEDDVAVLQLDGASGLDTVSIDDDDESIGQAITAVGNASGGGVLMAADGEITDLESTVTTSSEGSAAGETLDGMIEIAADVVSGDSGGAVLDAEGEVIGVTTAASSGTAVTVAYAIPIEDALDIVDQILAGDESDGVTLGYPAFLGVQVASDQATTSTVPGSSAGGYTSGGRPVDGASSGAVGATVAGVIDGTPAAQIGLAAGDTITAVDGTGVVDSAGLTEVLATYDAGDAVTITWTDASGATQSASVTLIEGPAA